MPSYFLIYKPYGVLSQFTAPEGKKSLKDFFQVPKDVYSVGRLDEGSEGLLILTNDRSLNEFLLKPGTGHEREYLVQVEGEITKQAVETLKKGVLININGKKIKTLPCKAEKLNQEPLVPERIPPIRFRKNIPTSWIRLILKEGRNRQVRKMTASTGYPTLRLIRYRLGHLTIENMQPGDIRSLQRKDGYLSALGT